jgi:uncharacterized protein YecT (DUF1311 family)
MKSSAALIRLAMASFCVLACLLVLFTPVALTQTTYGANQCERYQQVQIPPVDLPTPQDRAALASCDSVNLYFGINVAADSAAARKCAYLEREKNDLIGAILLSMVYANGKGADRNFDLALKFACEATVYELGTDTRVNHLLKLQEQHWTGTDFNLCADVTTMQAAEEVLACRELREHFDQAARRARLEKLTANWSPEEKKALADLQRVAGAFFQASAENETNLPTHGPGAAIYAEAYIIDAKVQMEDDFIATLERFEHGQLPNFAAAQFKQADANLNSAYKEILKEKDHPDPDAAPTSVDSNGIRTAQRAWLPYREAWVTFGKVKYPSVTAESWRTWLTQERARSFAGN